MIILTQNPFSVRANIALIIQLAPRRPHEEDGQKDVGIAFKWLKDALECCGAGAKTATGYGRFVRDEDAEKQLED